MKILMLCNKSPWPAIEGGPIAMNSMLEGLIAAGHEVKVLAVNSNKYTVDLQQIPEAYRLKSGIELEYINLSINPVHAFLNLFTGKSYHVERFISRQFRQKLISLLKTGNFDIIQMETLFMAPYLPEIRKYSRAKVVLRAHNVEHLIWKRLARAGKNPLKRRYLQHLASTLEHFELDALGKFDGIACITKKDAEFFAKHTTVPIIDIPYGVDPTQFEPRDELADFPSLYHIGAMNWMPNLEGIQWFIDEVWPLVNEKVPGLSCHLAGRYMPDWLKTGIKTNIVVAGEVPDAKSFIHSHAIAVVPLLSGSGIRIKIIESMALGKPVITTSIGAEGINYTQGENIMIADRAADFAEAIARCAADLERSIMMGKNARKLIELEYNNSVIIQRLSRFYQEIF
jgi:glycosyltransferase involved in cell wall biosynthesis